MSEWEGEEGGGEEGKGEEGKGEGEGYYHLGMHLGG